MNTTPHLRQAGYFELLLLALRRRQRFKISGNSMLPLLKPDDQVLIRPLGAGALMPGSIVVARHPQRKELVLAKEVASITPDGSIILAGINSAESTDSRTFGTVEREQVLGVVTAVL